MRCTIKTGTKIILSVSLVCFAIWGMVVVRNKHLPDDFNVLKVKKVDSFILSSTLTYLILEVEIQSAKPTYVTPILMTRIKGENFDAAIHDNEHVKISLATNNSIVLPARYCHKHSSRGHYYDTYRLLLASNGQVAMIDDGVDASHIDNIAIRKISVNQVPNNNHVITWQTAFGHGQFSLGSNASVSLASGFYEGNEKYSIFFSLSDVLVCASPTAVRDAEKGALVHDCPCPTAVREAENAEPDGETGAKKDGSPDENQSDNSETEK